MENFYGRIVPSKTLHYAGTLKRLYSFSKNLDCASNFSVFPAWIIFTSLQKCEHNWKKRETDLEDRAKYQVTHCWA